MHPWIRIELGRIRHQDLLETARRSRPALVHGDQGPVDGSGLRGRGTLRRIAVFGDDDRSMPGTREIVTGGPASDGDSNILRWLAVALATLAASIAMSAVGLPTPALFAALLIGIAYALVVVRRPLEVPSSGMSIGQALIGVAIGAELDASTLRAVGIALTLVRSAARSVARSVSRPDLLATSATTSTGATLAYRNATAARFVLLVVTPATANTTTYTLSVSTR